MNLLHSLAKNVVFLMSFCCFGFRFSALKLSFKRNLSITVKLPFQTKTQKHNPQNNKNTKQQNNKNKISTFRAKL